MIINIANKYTEEQRKLISSNPSVKNCGITGITFTPEFKVKVIKEYYESKSPKKIFEEEGLSLEFLKKGIWFYGSKIKEWKRIYKKKGNDGFTQSKFFGVIKKKKVKLKNLSDKEKLKFLEAQVEYLTAENSFLARLRAKKQAE